MLRYLARRLLHMIPLLLGITFLAFLVIDLAPGDYFVALRPNSISDRLLSFLAFFGMSLPSFFLAFLLMYLALRTGWFPVGGSFSVYYDSLTLWGKIGDRLRHLWLPMIVLGIGGMASL